MQKKDVFMWCSFAFLAGVLFALLFPVPPALFLYVAFLALPLFVIVVVCPRARFSAALAFIFMFGLVRGANGPISFSVFNTSRSYLERIAASFSSNIHRALPEPHASYLAGIVIGERGRIPYDLKDAFRRTGTSHLTALSGYNVSVVVEYLGVLTSSLWLALGGVFLFVLATGASSSVVRAAIMGSLVFLARRYGHDYGARNALCAAVVLMVFFNPPILTGDVGFQLSVAATAGLIAFSEYFEKKLLVVPKALHLRESLATTLAAQLATLPLIFYYFSGVSIWSLPANTLILGTMPFTMLCGFLVGTVGYASSYLALLAAWPAYLVLSYQLLVIHFFAAIHVF